MENSNNHKKDKGDGTMYNTVGKSDYRQLDLSKLKNRRRKTLSSTEALNNVTPINWSEDVICGKKKAIFTKEK